ncbi:Fe-S-containing hydro-lyase [Candidatus Poribacteria bacterium]|nr:Fe-S-containing hydro-lyase [Candidatus Poribacteria bacterium]
MPEPVILNTPLTDNVIEDLRVGQRVLINGIIYTARDAAHKRMVELLDNNQQLPFDIKGQVIYYAGPAPAKPGQVIGSCGPTTSYRMDPYAPKLIQHGLKGMIGKGTRSVEVKEAIKKYKSIYFAAVGGLGALLAKTVKEVKVIAYPDLGPEAIRRMTVQNFPAFVAIDIYDGDIYKEKKEVDNLAFLC